MKKAFTLVELVVAVGVLAMMISFAGLIFNVSIDSYRQAGALTEIMQKARAITDQLDRDFKGLQKDAPMMIRFHQLANPSNPLVMDRYDQIMFFANGDFQSTQLYNGGVPALSGTAPVIGNVARIHYGQANVNLTYPWRQTGEYIRDRILARRRHILSADLNLEPWPDESDVVGTFSYPENELYEHDSLSLAKWKTVDIADYDTVIIPDCFDDDKRPAIDFSSNPMIGLHKLMSQGVASFAVQWAYWDKSDPLNPLLLWYPQGESYQTVGNSDFHLMDTVSINEKQFGVYFNIPSSIPTTISGWHNIKDGNVEYFDAANPGLKFANDFYPDALKFTFRLYDSKGIIDIEDGQTFTHIVYLKD